jgi:hypothetical protein
MVMTVVMVMPVTMVPTRPAQIGRTQVNVDDASDRAEAGLTLQAERLQRNRVVRTTDQQVGTDTNTRRRVGADTAEVTGQRAAANPVARRVDDPRQTGFRGGAQIEAEALNVSDVGLRRRAIVVAEHALQLCGRADHVTDVRATMAFEDTGLNLFLGLGARDRREQRHGGHGEKSWEVHELISAWGLELADGHDGSPVSKTRQGPHQGIKKPGTLQKLNEGREPNRPQRNNAT